MMTNVMMTPVGLTGIFAPLPFLCTMDRIPPTFFVAVSRSTRSAPWLTVRTRCTTLLCISSALEMSSKSLGRRYAALDLSVQVVRFRSAKALQHYCVLLRTATTIFSVGAFCFMGCSRCGGMAATRRKLSRTLPGKEPAFNLTS